MRKPHIVLINGSLHGDSANSNTFVLLQLAKRSLLGRGASVNLISPERINFKDSSGSQSMHVLNFDKVMKALEEADGLIVGTGTHWGQSSSVLQKLLEDAAATEGAKAWLGKPTGIIVSEHSTGGQAVLSNLMLTLSNFGCMIVPQGGMVFGRTGQLARGTGNAWTDDVWGPDDIKSICGSVLAYAPMRETVENEPWSVDNDTESFHARWATRDGRAKKRARVIGKTAG